MNPEDDVRNLLRRARTDDSSSEQDWEVFMSKAHRSLALRRGLLATGAVVLVGMGVAAGAVLTDETRSPEPFAPAGSPGRNQGPKPEKTEDPGDGVRPTEASTEQRAVVQVWFLAGEEGDPVLAQAHRTVDDAVAVGRASIEALLSGPGADEDTLASYIPEGTRLLDLTIENATATVNFSREFNETGLGSGFEHLPLAQVVWTLTQFDTVESVVFEIEGERVEAYGGHGIVIDEPLKRDDYEDAAPPIVVDSPYPGKVVPQTFALMGSANVFEATVSYRVLDEELNVLDEGFTTATCGTGCRGEFSEKIRLPKDAPSPVVLEVFESSAEDGSPLHLVTVPLLFQP